MNIKDGLILYDKWFCKANRFISENQEYAKLKN